MTLFLILLGASLIGGGGLTAYILRQRKKGGPLPHPTGSVAWHKRYLPLLVITDTPNSSVESMINRACDTWNKAIEDAGIKIGGRMFVFSGYTIDAAAFEKPSPGVIPIKLVRDLSDHPHAQLIINSMTHEIRASPILLPIDMMDSKLRQVILHELGHVIGLPHSSDISSIMYPTAIATSTKITPADVTLLRSLYA
jgi:hypothetical protein